MTTVGRCDLLGANGVACVRVCVQQVAGAEEQGSCPWTVASALRLPTVDDDGAHEGDVQSIGVRERGVARRRWCSSRALKKEEDDGGGRQP